MMTLCSGAPTGDVAEIDDATATPIIDPLYYNDLNADEEADPELPGGWVPTSGILADVIGSYLDILPAATEAPFEEQVSFNGILG